MRAGQITFDEFGRERTEAVERVERVEVRERILGCARQLRDQRLRFGIALPEEEHLRFVPLPAVRRTKRTDELRQPERAKRGGLAWWPIRGEHAVDRAPL